MSNIVYGMKDYLHSDDKKLIAWTLDGDSKAFGEIVRRYESMVASTIVNMIGNTQVAEDVGQDTFIRLYKSLSEFRGDSKLSTYIHRIAINLSLNELKKKKRLVSLFIKNENSPQNTEIDIPDKGSGSEERNDLKEILELAINKLPVEFKSVVVLRLVHGYSTKETSEILELPSGTVLSRLSRARDQLKKEINKLM